MVSRLAAPSPSPVAPAPDGRRTWTAAIAAWQDLTGQGLDDLAELIGVGEGAVRAWGPDGPSIDRHALSLAVVLLAEGIAPPDDRRLPAVITSSPASRRGVVVRLEPHDGHTLPRLDEISVSMRSLGLRVTTAQSR